MTTADKALHQLTAAETVIEPCPACGDAEFRPLLGVEDRLFASSEQSFQMGECPTCRLVRLHPQPTPSELRDLYPTDYWLEPDRLQTGWLESLFRRFLSRDHLHFIERSLDESEEPGLVLEVGSSGGLLLKMLAERGRKNVVALEFGIDAAASIWRGRRVRAACATLSRPPLRPGSCALMMMFHVLEHLYDPVSYLESARDLLAPDGRLILQIRNAASWQFLLFGERWSGLNTPRHLIQFRRNDMKALLADCGFTILREKQFSLRDNPTACATSLAPWLDPSVRRLRATEETPRKRFWKTAAYYALTAACIPFALLESACQAGATIIIEAVKTPE